MLVLEVHGDDAAGHSPRSRAPRVGEERARQARRERGEGEQEARIERRDENVDARSDREGGARAREVRKVRRRSGCILSSRFTSARRWRAHASASPKSSAECPGGSSSCATTIPRPSAARRASSSTPSAPSSIARSNAATVFFFWASPDDSAESRPPRVPEDERAVAVGREPRGRAHDSSRARSPRRASSRRRLCRPGARSRRPPGDLRRRGSRRFRRCCASAACSTTGYTRSKFCTWTSRA